MARRSDRDQGSHGRGLPPSKRLQSALDRPARRIGSGGDGHGPDELGGAATSGREPVAQWPKAFGGGTVLFARAGAIIRTPWADARRIGEAAAASCSRGGAAGPCRER